MNRSFNIDDLFIDSYKLPKPLPEEELIIMFKKINNGSREARDKVIIHNIRLVLFEVTSKYQNIDYDKTDLVAAGILGLIKATETYNLGKTIKFSTYAIKCIDNEILMILRKEKKYNNIDSLDRVISYNKDGYELNLKETIEDGKDFVEEFLEGDEKAQIYNIIRDEVSKLPDRDRQIIMMYFGFFNNHSYNQKEIANKLNISQSYVCILLHRILKKLRNILKVKETFKLLYEQYEKRNQKQNVETVEEEKKLKLEKN